LKAINYKGNICFSNYGEPLLDKRLESFVRMAREYFPKSNIFIATNGDLLTVERFRNLVKAGMSKFFITQQGNPIPKNHILLKKVLTEEEKKFVGWYYLDENGFLQNRGGYVKVKSKRIPKKICNLNSLIIKADGLVCACCQDYFHDINMGNSKTEKIMDIWFSPTFKSLRKNLMKGKAEYELCKKCYLFTG
jgi:radical SAM protein with 4Fe4S-binding SPASM domain